MNTQIEQRSPDWFVARRDGCTAFGYSREDAERKLTIAMMARDNLLAHKTNNAINRLDTMVRPI